MLALNSKPLYNTWLSNYPLLVKDLDITYGGPIHNKKTAIKGRKALGYILEFLSASKQASCENIAQSEYDKNPNTKRKLKSITDNIREFIEDNLIPRLIINEDGFYKKYNKKVTTYSLTPFGILYSIHFFSSDKKITQIINNLEKEYQDTLPKIFNKFLVFKEMFGDKYLDVIGLQRIADNTLNKYLLTTQADILSNFVHLSSGAWLGDPIFLIGSWENQISLLVYTSIISHICYTAMLESWNTGEDDTVLTKKRILNFWKKLDEVDPKIEKWYLTFVKEFISNNKKEKKDILEIMWWKK